MPLCGLRRTCRVDCRVRAAIARVIRGGLRTSNDAQKNGPHKCRLKDRHGTTDETRPADTPTPMRHGAALCGDRHTGRRTMHTVIACHAPAPTSGGRGAPANSSGEPACAARRNSTRADASSPESFAFSCDGKKRCEAVKKELDRATNVNVGCSDELEQLSSSKLCLRALAAAMRVRAAQNLAQRLRLGV